jgi:plasmid maintenance system antidote protein VapI
MTKYKKLIKEKGLKETWVANQLCIPRTTFANYLSGKSNFPPDIEFKLNKILFN